MAAAQNMAMTTTQKIIAIAVTIIIISTVALPVIEDVQKSISAVAQNTDYTYMVMNEGTSTANLVYTVGSDGIELNGTYIGFHPGGSTPIIFVDNLAVSPTNDQTGFNIYYKSGGNSAIEFSASSIEFKETGEIIVTTSDSEELELSYSKIYFYASSGGNYGVWKSTSYAAPAMIHLDHGSKAFAAVFTWITNANQQCFISEYQGGVFTQSLAVGLPAAGYTTSIQFNSNSTPDELSDLVGFQSKITVSGGGSSTTVNQDNTTIIAPIQYHYVDSDSPMGNLFSVVAILLILVPLMMAVRMMVLKRN